MRDCGPHNISHETSRLKYLSANISFHVMENYSIVTTQEMDVPLKCKGAKVTIPHPQSNPILYMRVTKIRHSRSMIYGEYTFSRQEGHTCLTRNMLLTVM